MINLKSKSDIDGIKKAGEIVGKVLEEMASITEPGIKTIEYDILADKITGSYNAQPAFKGYHGFPYSVCVSVNEEVVHGFPSQRRLKEGDIVSLDFGSYWNGYYADAAVTVPVGNISKEAERLLEVTKAALVAGINQAIAGNEVNDISIAIQKIAEDNEFSVVRDFVGHGVGFKLHEDPQIPNYFIKNNQVLLQEGAVLAIEPMVNEGGFKVRIKQNGWTVVTKDKGLSAHFEHTVAVTKDGPVILTKI